MPSRIGLKRRRVPKGPVRVVGRPEAAHRMTGQRPCSILLTLSALNRTYISGSEMGLAASRNDVQPWDDSGEGGGGGLPESVRYCLPVSPTLYILGGLLDRLEQPKQQGRLWGCKGRTWGLPPSTLRPAPSELYPSQCRAWQQFGGCSSPRHSAEAPRLDQRWPSAGPSAPYFSSPELRQP